MSVREETKGEGATAPVMAPAPVDRKALVTGLLSTKSSEVAEIGRLLLGARGVTPGDETLRAISLIAAKVHASQRGALMWYFLRPEHVPGEMAGTNVRGTKERPSRVVSYSTFIATAIADGATVKMTPLRIPRAVQVSLGLLADTATRFSVCVENSDVDGDTLFEFEFGKETTIPAAWVTYFLQNFPGCFLDTAVEGLRRRG